jgi:hypothetical protein
MIKHPMREKFQHTSAKQDDLESDGFAASARPENFSPRLDAFFARRETNFEVR